MIKLRIYASHGLSFRDPLSGISECRKVNRRSNSRVRKEHRRSHVCLKRTTRTKPFPHSRFTRASFLLLIFKIARPNSLKIIHMPTPIHGSQHNPSVAPDRPRGLVDRSRHHQDALKGTSATLIYFLRQNSTELRVGASVTRGL